MTTSSGGIVSSGTTQSYGGGTTLVGYTVYGTLKLDSATVSSGLVTSGGVEYVGQGGIAVRSGLSVDDTVNSGGTIRAENYGSASATRIGDGGTLLVDNGGSATSASVGSGGVVSVFNAYGTAGTVYETTVLSGGAELLSGGGANGVNDVIRSGGSGYASAGANEIVSSGTGSGFTALSGGKIIISSGGTGYDEVASSGGYIGVAGGVVSNAVLYSGAWMDLASAGGPSVASGTILSGGREYMYPQGSSVSGIVRDGGQEYVGQAGGYPRSGTSIDDTVSSGGTIFVENGGTATGTVANDGGRINVDNGGRAISGIISSGGLISAYSNYNSGGTVSAFSVLSSGTAIIGNGASGIANSAGDGGTIAISGGGTGTANSAGEGGTIAISNGGTGYNDQAVSGGSLWVSSGGSEFASAGTATNATVLSGGSVQVFSGGVASHTVVSSGGEFRNGKYGGQGSAVVGTDIDTVFSSGASALYYNRAVSISAQVLDGASIDFGYGQDGSPSDTNLSILSAATISSGGLVQMRKATLASDVTLAGGALNLIESGARASGTTVRNGGVETLSGNTVETGGTISSGGTVVINASSSLSSETLLDRGSIDFKYLGGSIVSATVTSSGLMKVTANNGSQTSVQLAGVYPENENTFILDGDTATLVCFLDETAIATPDGTKNVEDLAIGDAVLTHDWRTGRDVAETLVWVGHQEAVVRPHLPDDEAGWPVRIRQDAIADGVPARDLVVTAEHCLFFDGQFIPARMLVNGSTIAYDRDRTRFTVFHVETARHSVLRAEGALTESYLDTGNRRNFAQPGRVAVLDRTVSTWEHDAAAPLAVSREAVEPVYRRLAARAGDVSQGQTTSEHGLVLRTAQGIIHPTRSRNGRVVFRLPGGLSQVELLSRADRPFDAVGPFMDDRRTLGVLVGAVTLFENDVAHTLTGHLDAGTLPGWHDREAGAYRWTDGHAVLPLKAVRAAPSAVVPAHVILAIEIVAAGPYRIDRPAPGADIMASETSVTSLRA